MVTTKASRSSLFIMSSVGAILLAACGTGDDPPATGISTTSPAPSVTTTTSEPDTTGSAPASTTPTPKPTDDGLCHADDVELTLGKVDAGAGSRYQPLLITNVSGRTCTIQGFPGVSYVAGEDGHQVGEAAYRDGTKGNPVELNTGQTASAIIHFVNVHNYEPAQCRPTPVRGLRVYLPQETVSKYLAAPGTACAATEIPGHQLAVKTVHPA